MGRQNSLSVPLLRGVACSSRLLECELARDVDSGHPFAFFFDSGNTEMDAASSTNGVFVSPAVGTPSWTALNSGLGSISISGFGGLVTAGNPVLLAGNPFIAGQTFAQLFKSRRTPACSARMSMPQRCSPRTTCSSALAAAVSSKR